MIWLAFIFGGLLGFVLGALTLIVFIDWCQTRISQFIHKSPEG